MVPGGRSSPVVPSVMCRSLMIASISTSLWCVAQSRGPWSRAPDIPRPMVAAFGDFALTIGCGLCGT